MTDFPFSMFKPDPKVDARILDSVMPSNFFPQAGQYFRVRSATIADRSYMGDIWQCIQAQDHCAVGKRVLDTYTGLQGSRIGEIKAFVSGDVIFYDCTQIWQAVQAEQAKVAQPEADTSAAG